jgi:hypothetical protein
MKKMREINILVGDINIRMKRIGIDKNEGYRSVIWSDFEKDIVIKINIDGEF